VQRCAGGLGGEALSPGLPSRQPISTAGITSGRKVGIARPVKPASSLVWRTSTANSPNPCSSQARSQPAMAAAVRSRSATTPVPIHRMTSGSASTAVMGVMSSSRQRRSTSRRVSSLVIGPSFMIRAIVARRRRTGSGHRLTLPETRD